MASIKAKYLVGNLTKLVKDLYKKNLKGVKTELEENIRKWKDFPMLMSW